MPMSHALLASCLDVASISTIVYGDKNVGLSAQYTQKESVISEHKKTQTFLVNYSSSLAYCLTVALIMYAFSINFSTHVVIFFSIIRT